jgi:hypothetical protein
MWKFAAAIVFSFVAVLSFPRTASGAEPANSVEDWWSTVEQVTEFTTLSRDGSLRLTVKLQKIAVTEKIEVSGDGERVRYYHKGARLPPDFWPGRPALVRFELFWEGTRVPIPERFWADLYGFRVQATPLKTDGIPERMRHSFEQFLAQLDQPRVILSADGGTALIEWERPEECDSRSTYRWMVTKDGRVLRHCDRPPHEC